MSESLLVKQEAWVPLELVAVVHEEEAVPFAVVLVAVAVGEGVATAEVYEELEPRLDGFLLTTEV